MSAVYDLVAYFDGSCGPRNPGGTAAYGYVIKDSDGNDVFMGYGRVITGPNATNNVAEFEGLYQAMKWIVENRPEARVMFYGDSNLVIEQMNGRAKAKRGKYLPYYAKAMSLALARIRRRQWSFEWIPRGLNSQADNLAQYSRFPNQ